MAWIGMQIKAAVSEVALEQARVKEELVGKQNEMREDMDAKHAQNAADIKAHSAEDFQQFASLNRTLQRIDTRADEQTRKQETTALTLARIEGKLDSHHA